MLFIQDDQAEMCKRGEQGAPRSDHDIELTGFCALHLIETLAAAQSRMKHGDTVAESLVKTKLRLIGQGNLRNQHDHLLSCFYDLLDHVQINLGFARSGHTIEKVGFADSFFKIIGETARRLPLIPIEFHRGRRRQICRQRVAERAAAFNRSPAFFFKITNRLRGNSHRCRDLLPGQAPVGKKSSQESFFGGTVIFSSDHFGQKPASLLLGRKEDHRPAKPLPLLFLHRKHDMKCLIHRPAIIAADPVGERDHL